MSNEITRASTAGASLTEKIKYAEHLAQAGMLPKSYQKQPANVLLAMEYGDALGIHPLTAINKINVINGTPSLSADLMQSLVRAAGHKVRVSGDAERAVCTIIRKDDPEYEHASEWTKAKAESSGLWGRGHWSKDPALMLKWRAISECVRLACSEVLAGLYTPEEVAEITSSEWKSQPPQPAPSAPSPEPAKDAAADRLTAIWDDPAAIDSALPWLRSNRPELAEKAAARLAEFEAADNTETEGQTSIEDAEIVEDTNE